MTLLDVIKEKYPEVPTTPDTLVLPEKYLFELPDDWMEFIMGAVSLQRNADFDFSFGSSHLICLDDEQTAQSMRIISKGCADIYVISKLGNDNLFWNVIVNKNADDIRIFIGGENLRTFCDKKNIFYKSGITDDKLMSATNLRYLKNEGEDCREPLHIPKV